MQGIEVGLRVKYEEPIAGDLGGLHVAGRACSGFSLQVSGRIRRKNAVRKAQREEVLRRHV